jgi:hypothetical protein
MAVLKYRDPTTQAWVSLASIAGPAGPPGPAGPTGPAAAGGLDQATADTLYVNVAGDVMRGVLAILAPVVSGVDFSTAGASVRVDSDFDPTALIIRPPTDGYITVQGATIANVHAPYNADDATNKAYVDGKILSGTAAPTGVYPAGTIYAQYS